MYSWALISQVYRFKVLGYELGCMHGVNATSSYMNAQAITNQATFFALQPMLQSPHPPQHWLQCLVPHCVMGSAAEVLNCYSICRYLEIHTMVCHACADAGIIMSQHASAEADEGGPPGD